MSHDGQPARARGDREVDADRRAADVAAATRSLIHLPTHDAATRARARRLRLAGLVVTTIALVAAACGSSSGSGGVAGATGTPLATASTGGASASTEASASASAGQNKGFLVFQEQNASKVFGGGTLIDLGDGSTAVSLGVVAIGCADPLPARLVTGACTDAATAPPPSFAPVPSSAASAGASGAAS